MSQITDDLIETLKAMQPDGSYVEYVKTDDLGEHYVLWAEKTDKDGGPAGIYFYVDEINVRVVVESIGAPP